MDPFQQYIKQIVPLTDAEWAAFRGLFTEASLKRGEYFAMEGRKEQSLGFLTEGVIRAFFRHADGKEYNKTFFTEQEFFAPYASLITQQPSYINLQALTPCRFYQADYRSLSDLFVTYRSIETLARRLAESMYIYKEKREIELVLLQADERYRIFKEEYPDLEKRIPQYHIASYLGITPTQLSRIRAAK